MPPAACRPSILSVNLSSSVDTGERSRRRLLDVIKKEFDRRGHTDINPVQALVLYNIGEFAWLSRRSASSNAVEPAQTKPWQRTVRPNDTNTLSWRCTQRCSSVRNESSTILSRSWSAAMPAKLCMTSSLA